MLWVNNHGGSAYTDAGIVDMVHDLRVWHLMLFSAKMVLKLLKILTSRKCPEAAEYLYTRT